MDIKKHFIYLSTGKDSEACLWWAFNTLPFDRWEVIYNELDWDADEVYQHLEYLQSRVGKIFIRTRAKSYKDYLPDGIYEAIVKIFGKPTIFAELAAFKTRFPSTKMRFCTDKLKVEPGIDYILDHVHEDCVIVQGVRAEESEARRLLKANDDYFKHYFEPYKTGKNGKGYTNSYRRDDVIKHCDLYQVDVLRPILKLTHNQVFNIIFDNHSPANALYSKGQARVGCYPCIMCKLSEIRLIAINNPERIAQIAELEILIDSTFFPPDYIPQKYCTKIVAIPVYRKQLIKLFGNRLTKSKKAALSKGGGLFDVEPSKNPEEMLYQMYFRSDKIPVHIDDDGDEYIIRRVRCPTINDVVRYVMESPNQTEALTASTGCISVYNICEAP